MLGLVIRVRSEQGLLLRLGLRLGLGLGLDLELMSVCPGFML